MQRLAHEIYYFDDFRLDLTRGALFRGPDELKLRPKSFDVLRYFAENSGRLIGKDELIEAVWHETAVTDDSLVQCLKDIRNVLGDKSQSIIRTVPRRGYIFERDVVQNGAAVGSETTGVRIVIEETEELRSQERVIESAQPFRTAALAAARRHKVTLMAATVGFAAVVITGVFLAKPVLTKWLLPPSVAVLPLVNATGDANLDYISDGLTDSIITSLSQVNEVDKIRLRVTAANAVFNFKGKDLDPLKAGHDLGVDTVVVSKMFDQDGLRNFKVEVIKVEDGSIRWKNQYSNSIGRPNDFLETQNQIPGADRAEAATLLETYAHALGLEGAFG